MPKGGHSRTGPPKARKPGTVLTRVPQALADMADYEKDKWSKVGRELLIAGRLEAGMLDVLQRYVSALYMAHLLDVGMRTETVGTMEWARCSRDLRAWTDLCRRFANDLRLTPASKPSNTETPAPADAFSEFD